MAPPKAVVAAPKAVVAAPKATVASPKAVADAATLALLTSNALVAYRSDPPLEYTPC